MKFSCCLSCKLQGNALASALWVRNVWQWAALSLAVGRREPALPLKAQFCRTRLPTLARKRPQGHSNEVELPP
jgi:hypothetical protein